MTKKEKKEKLVLLMIFACLMLSMVETHLYSTWKLHSGTSKDEIECCLP